MIFVFQNFREYDISNLYLQYSFVFTFTNIFLTIRQDWYYLFNHCLSTQWGPHVRLRAMPRAVFSFTNNIPFYHKQSILSGNNTSSVEIIQSSSFEDGPIVIRPEVLTLHYCTLCYEVWILNVIGIRPMAPVLNTGPLERIWARNVKFFGKERNF